MGVAEDEGWDLATSAGSPPQGAVLACLGGGEDDDERHLLVLVAAVQVLACVVEAVAFRHTVLVG